MESRHEWDKALVTSIIEELKQARFNEWLKGLQARFTVKVDNPAYFTPRRAPALQTVR